MSAAAHPPSFSPLAALQDGVVANPNLLYRWSPGDHPTYSGRGHEAGCEKEYLSNMDFPCTLITFTCPHGIIQVSRMVTGAESLAVIMEMLVTHFLPSGCECRASAVGACALSH